jgi:hypothetical protein
MRGNRAKHSEDSPIFAGPVDNFVAHFDSAISRRFGCHSPSPTERAAEAYGRLLPEQRHLDWPICRKTAQSRLPIPVNANLQNRALCVLSPPDFFDSEHHESMDS